MKINDQLCDLYSKYWTELLSALDREDANSYTNPFLINVDEENMAQADLRIMILGQETKGWGDKTGISRSVKEGMERYRKFYVERNFYKGYGRSAFWKGFRFFKKKIERHNNEKEIYFIWNNVSKIGRPNGKVGVSPGIRSIERKLFPVLKEEVKIIRPDIMIFLSGPDRDHDIKFHFEDFESFHSGTSCTKRQLAIVKATGLPSMSIRTYHPSFYKGFNKKLKENALFLLTNKASGLLASPLI